jgi:hypothetical protein
MTSSLIELPGGIAPERPLRRLIARVSPVKLAVGIFFVAGALIVAPFTVWMFAFGGAMGHLHEGHIVGEFARLFLEVGSNIAPLAGAISVMLYCLFWPVTRRPRFWNGLASIFAIEIGCFVFSILLYLITADTPRFGEAPRLIAIVVTGYLALPWWLSLPPLAAFVYAVYENVKGPQSER